MINASEATMNLHRTISRNVRTTEISVEEIKANLAMVNAELSRFSKIQIENQTRYTTTRNHKNTSVSKAEKARRDAQKEMFSLEDLHETLMFLTLQKNMWVQKLAITQ